ncbi:MAG: PIN domain-containing protein [Desulfatitalea sp.]|nr:PIN domain-containing protein [Desulfatitalea sp.]
MKRYLLDTSALLTLRDNEPGADQVADLLYGALKGTNRCMICFISLMELFYRVWKDENESAGRLSYQQCRSLPISIIHESDALLEGAARIKATHRLSLADAWIASSAIQEGATLVHKDPEFSDLNCPQIKLPNHQ